MEVKARNAKSLSARCAGACPLGGVSTRARSAAGGECGKGSRLSAETREEKGLMVKCTPERGHNALFFIPLEVFIML